MSEQLIIRLDPGVKKKLAKVARNESKTVSQVIRELIENYIRDQDIGIYINDLWDRIGSKLKSRGIKLADIDRTIKEIRASKK